MAQMLPRISPSAWRRSRQQRHSRRRAKNHLSASRGRLLVESFGRPCRKGLIMKGSFVIAAFVTAGLSLSAETAFAGRRHRCCTPQPACCVPASPCAAAAVSPAAPTPAPETAPQATNPRTYQSFSYEPGTAAPPAPAPVFAPVRTVQPRANSLYDSIRADRKARGY